MGWNDRAPTPVDPDADPLLPQADSSQGHDIPTGVSPTTAKLQDWIAWLRANVVLSPVVDLEVTNDLVVDGSTTLGSFLAMFGAAPTATADPGANVFHNAHIPKSCGRIITDGAGNYNVPSSGVNLGLATLGTTYVDIDFVRAFANNDYVPVATNISGNSDYATIDYANSTASKLRLQMRSSGGALRNPQSEVCAWSLMVMGRQA